MRATATKTWLVMALLACVPAQAQQPVTGGAARLAAWERHQAMAESSPFKGLEWQRLGPKFVGGRIESIDAPRGRPGTIYVGVGAGGIWKTTNGGLTFEPIFERESTFAIGDLTVAPSEPDTVWVGTGEAHLSGTSYSGTGVFKSTDGGATWKNMGLHDSAHIGKVVIDPNDADVVYVAAMGPRNTEGGERGIYKTIDGGRTFRRVLFVGPEVALVDLVLDPTDSTRLLAAAWDRSGGRESGVFRSTDSGESWERLHGGLLDADVGRVAIDASASEPGVFYALMVDHSPEGGGRSGVGGILYRSDDGGDTWNRTHPEYLPTYVGWDFCDVRVSPDNANQVYIGGFRLLVSQDGGKTFENGGETVFRLHPHRGTGMHLDMHDIWIDPEHPERILLGNDGGIYESWDRAQTWLHLNTLPIAEFYRVYLDDEEPFRIWAGTQDNASLVGPSTARFAPGAPDEWEQVFLDRWAGGDGFSTFPDPNDPALVYYSQQQGNLKRARFGELEEQKRIRPVGEEGQAELRWAWDTPFFASVHTADTRLYAAAQRVFASDDRGDSWEAISPDLGDGPLLALSESPLDEKRLVAGLGRGELHFTDDGGESWRSAGNGLPEKTIRDVVTSVHHADRVYVTLSGVRDDDYASYVYVTHDFGRTWEAIGGNLPDEPVNAIAEDPRAESVLFVGTDLGVFASVDAGAHWASLGRDLPTAPVVDLAVQERDDVLVAVTHGLSAFLLAIGSVRDAVVPESRPNILILMADDWNWPQSEGVSDPNLQTPTFDRIAAEGVRFSNAFVDSPSCTPSRAALLTGMHPWMLETGVHLWGALPAAFDTYTDILEEAGYLVGYSGKGWGPGYLEEARREDNPAGRIVVGDPPGRAWDSRDRVATFEDFLARREEGQPFHFWFNTSEPHRPYEWQSGLRRGMSLADIVVPPTLPDTEETRTDLADYYYEVEMFDTAAAELIAHLEELGELDNTIVVMTGDNGMPFPRAKMTLYDLGTRVPLAVRWPNRVGGGRVVEDFVTFSDMAPTFLEAAGISPPAAMSGRSFLAALESPSSGLLDADRTRAFSSIELHCGRYPMRAIRTPEYLYVRNYEPERPVNLCASYWESEAGYSPTWISVLALDPASAMYQRIVGARPSEELYDLAADPYQLDNVAAASAYEAIRDLLATELDAELRRTGDPRVDGRHEEVFYIPHQENARLRNR